MDRTIAVHRDTGECFQIGDHRIYLGLIEIQLLSDTVGSEAWIQSGISGSEVDGSVMSDGSLQGANATGMHHRSVGVAINARQVAE